MTKLGVVGSLSIGLVFLLLAVLFYDHQDSAVAESNQYDTLSVDIKNVDDTLYMLLGKEMNGKSSLWYQSSADQGKTWSPEIDITKDEAISAKFTRGNDARLAVQGDTLIAVWMSKVDGNMHGGGPMVVMRSVDKGLHWNKGTMPADWQGSHGFFAIDANDKAIDLVWLDSREQAGEGAQGLRYTQSIDGGLSWSANQTLDAVSCACCWNTAKFADDGMFYVLYRDKEPSDMSIGRVDPQQNWQRLSTVGEFGWDFQGCPHIGAGLAIDETRQQFHATVSTGDTKQSGVYYLNSLDHGTSWSKPVQLGDNTAVHSDIAVAEKTAELLAVWDRITESGLQVVYSRSIDQGKSWSTPVLLSPTGISASHPRVLSVDNGFFVAWTQQDKGQQTLQMTQLLLEADSDD